METTILVQSKSQWRTIVNAVGAARSHSKYSQSSPSQMVNSCLPYGREIATSIWGRKAEDDGHQQFSKPLRICGRIGSKKVAADSDAYVIRKRIVDDNEGSMKIALVNTKATRSVYPHRERYEVRPANIRRSREGTAACTDRLTKERSSWSKPRPVY